MAWTRLRGGTPRPPRPSAPKIWPGTPPPLKTSASGITARSWPPLPRFRRSGLTTSSPTWITTGTRSTVTTARGCSLPGSFPIETSPARRGPGRGEPDQSRRAPGTLHQGHPTGLQHGHQGHTAGDLLRGGGERLRPGADATAGAGLRLRVRQHLYHVSRPGGGPDQLPPPASPFLGEVRDPQHRPQRRSPPGEPD